MENLLKTYIICVIFLLSWVWGDCEEGEVELWDECYSIEETTLLYLSSSGLTGEIPPEIGNLSNLVRLYLENNQLTGSIPPEIGDLINLLELSLYSNQLTGPIPPEIGELENLINLFLTSNQLTGSIPSEIANLTNLNWLILYENQLTGIIPSEMGNLTNLIYLNLSTNQLAGEIPESLCQLVDNGFYLNFNDNKLCPPYPECIEDYVGEQDTTNCSLESIIINNLSDWTLMGLPLEVANANYLILFPDAIENTLFSFDDAYTPDSIMIEGEGYWIRFENAGNTTIIGNTINELTISLNGGWNLISGISIPLSIIEIQDPDGIIIIGTIYGFNLNGYSNEENLEPGKGYWIRANNSGFITLIDN